MFNDPEMIHVLGILRRIQETSSRNTKKQIIQENRDNDLFRKFLLYAYNPRWIYGVGPKTIKSKPNTFQTSTAPQATGVTQKSLFGNTTTTGRIYCGYTNIFDLCIDLMLHPFGSNEDVNAINTFLSKCNEEEFYWYSALLKKDLKIGCSASTINEVIRFLIPEFDVMLAHPYKNHINKVVGEFQIQKKLDGFRFVVFHHEDGKLQFFTRNGVELFNFPEIEDDFKHVNPLPGGMVYDGELQANDSFNDTQKLVMRNGSKVGLSYHIFDCLTISEFEREESFDKLFHRYDRLCDIFIYTEYKALLVVPELYRGDDLSKISLWFDHAKAHKWEGIMIKLNAPYVRKRTTTMLKVKEMDNIDLRVIRVNPGTGKHEGRLGSVTVMLDDVEVDVGSGFTDSERIKYWEDPNLIIDKIIEIQYFEKTINESGLPSLRFPVFKRIRIDK